MILIVVLIRIYFCIFIEELSDLDAVYIHA